MKYKNWIIQIRVDKTPYMPEIMTTYLRATDIWDVINTLQTDKNKRTSAGEIVAIIEPEDESLLDN